MRLHIQTVTMSKKLSIDPKDGFMKKIHDSYIVDEFEGWNGDSIYQLDDGTIWKLAVYQYTYTYSYRPKASIYSSQGNYFLEVEGMGKAVEVIKIG